MVLGPTLILIYINDINDNIHHSESRLFADDIILYKQVSSVNDANYLQSDLQPLQYWEEKWLLKSNINIMPGRSRELKFTKWSITINFITHL